MALIDRLRAALADTAANPLAVEHRWSFTTLALPGSAVPEPTVLYPAIPNPFNPMTRVSFELGQGGPVLMRVFAVDGRFVRTLIRADLQGGRRYWKTWDGRDEEGRALPSGAVKWTLSASRRFSPPAQTTPRSPLNSCSP